MKPRIAFVFGGRSVEHEISIITGLQAFSAFKSDKYDAYPLYLTKNNEMYVGPELEVIENYRNIDDLLSRSARVVLVSDTTGNKLVGYPMKKFGKSLEVPIDMAFLCVHGTNVEDGALQGYFKTLGVPIVGCDVESAAVGMDKFAQKAIVKAAKIPVLKARKYNVSEFSEPDALVKQIEDKFSYPVIVKPLNLGSSIGIEVAKNSTELHEALDVAFSYSTDLIVERALTNFYEINCAVLGDGEACKPSEIEKPFSADEILSYKDKYMSGSKNGGSKGMASVTREIPARVPEKMKKKIQKYATKAFSALGCNGVARIDFLVDEDDGEIYFNEINTIPGSLAFYLFEPLSMSYSELLSEMVRLAEKRQREESRVVYSFDTNVLNSATLSGSKGK